MKLKQCNCVQCRYARKKAFGQRVIKACKHAHRSKVKQALKNGKDESQIDKVCALPYMG